MTAQHGRLRSTSLGSVGDSKTPIWANDYVNERLLSPKQGDDPRVTKMAVSFATMESFILERFVRSHTVRTRGRVFLLPLLDLLIVVGTVVNYTFGGVLKRHDLICGRKPRVCHGERNKTLFVLSIFLAGSSLFFASSSFALVERFARTVLSPPYVFLTDRTTMNIL